MTEPKPDTVVLVHGLWMTPRSWENWVEYYQAKGLTVLTPGYPGFEIEVEALRENPDIIADLKVGDTVDHLSAVIESVGTPPLIMGHSFGGTLTQHLPDEVGHERHRPHPGSFDDSDHQVRLSEGSLAALAAGETVHNTKSHHHQGLEVIAEPFEVTGHSMIDDVPEAIEAPYRRFVLGVQWHPEADERSRVIGALIERARDYRDTRVSA